MILKAPDKQERLNIYCAVLVDLMTADFSKKDLTISKALADNTDGFSLLLKDYPELWECLEKSSRIEIISTPNESRIKTIEKAILLCD